MTTETPEPDPQALADWLASLPKAPRTDVTVDDPEELRRRVQQMLSERTLGEHA